jgi:hypothetical protein
VRRARCCATLTSVPDDDYPFPIDQLLAVDATDEDAANYENTVVRLLNEWIRKQGGSIHGQSGVLLSVELDGEGPTSRLRLHYRSHAGGEYDAHWPVWDDQALDAPRIAAGRPNLDCPEDLCGIVWANWLDGSTYAADDPYWAAVERQAQAMSDWRSAYPEAIAALPALPRNATVEQQRAAWAEWARHFPEAAARRAEAWRPVEDFLD